MAIGSYAKTLLLAELSVRTPGASPAEAMWLIKRYSVNSGLRSFGRLCYLNTPAWRASCDGRSVL
jgi:hypothetical protein